MREPAQASTTPATARWLELIADPIRLGILRSLSQVPEATTSDLATRSQASCQTLRRHLEALVSLGVVREHPAQRDGETPGRPAARFSLSSEVRESVCAVFGPPTLRRTGVPVAQAVASPAFASTSAVAAAGPMNGARAK